MGILLYIFRALGVSFWLAVATVPGVLRGLFKPFDPYNGGLFCQVLSPFGLKIAGVELENRRMGFYDQLPKAIYVANHQSNLDLLIFGYHQMKGKNITIGKKEIKYFPFFGTLFWLSGHLLIDRKDQQHSHSKVNELEQKIKERKESLWIFPEGTRSKTGRLGKFKKGPFRMAINTQLPIVPVVCCSLDKNVDFKRWHAGKVITYVMDPIETKGKTLDDLDSLIQQVHQLMAQKIDELDQEMALQRA